MMRWACNLNYKSIIEQIEYVTSLMMTFYRKSRKLDFCGHSRLTRRSVPLCCRVCKQARVQARASVTRPIMRFDKFNMADVTFDGFWLLNSHTFSLWNCLENKPISKTSPFKCLQKKISPRYHYRYPPG